MTANGILQLEELNIAAITTYSFGMILIRDTIRSRLKSNSDA